MRERSRRMKPHQIYNAAIDDVLDTIDDWWKTGETTGNMISRIKRLKRDVVVLEGETNG